MLAFSLPASLRTPLASGAVWTTSPIASWGRSSTHGVMVTPIEIGQGVLGLLQRDAIEVDRDLVRALI